MLRLPELRRRTVVLTTSPLRGRLSKHDEAVEAHQEEDHLPRGPPPSERTAASATASGTDVEQKACEKAIAASIAYYGKSKVGVRLISAR